MAISLQKGQKISLTKDNSGLSKIIVGLGWDQKKKQSGGLFKFKSKEVNVDCDASILLCRDGKLATQGDLVYFGNLTHSSNAVKHLGDNTTGAGDGDDEQVKVDLKSVPAAYDKIVFVVNIYQCIQRQQHFGMIENAFIRIMDESNGQEICRYNLTDDCSNKTALIFGEVYRSGTEWKFSAIGEATTDPGLAETVKRFN